MTRIRIPSAMALIAIMASILSACAPAVETTPIPNPGPGYDEQQKALEAGRAQEEAALAGLRPEFAARLRAWKEMPLKNCSAASLGEEDPLARRNFDANASYRWDARALFERTNGTMVAVTPDYDFYIELQNQTAIETRLLEESKVVAELIENNLRGGRSKIELREAGANCFLVIDGRVAYQTALFAKIEIGRYANLNPVVQSKIGLKPEDGILPHRTLVDLERDLFPFRDGLAMKIETKVPAAFFRGDFHPRRVPADETTRQFLNYFHPRAYDNLPVAARTLSFNDPRMSEAGLWVEGTSLQTPVSADGGRLLLPVANDPFASERLRMQYEFRGPAFDYLFYSNIGRRVLLRYDLEFAVKERLGTRLRGQITSQGARLEGLTPIKQTACLNEILRTRPFDATGELTRDQLLGACRSSELDPDMAMFQPDFTAQLLAFYRERSSFNPRVGERLVLEVARALTTRFGASPLPDWWKGQTDWRFAETGKANSALFGHVEKLPELSSLVNVIILKTQLYDQVYNDRRFQPRALEQLIFVVSRLKKAGLPARDVVPRYQAAAWSGMGENEMTLFAEGIRGLRAEDQLNALSNPQAVVQRVIAERREAARRAEVQKRVTEMDVWLKSLSAELQSAVSRESVGRAFAAYADRASKNALRADHVARVDRWTTLLKTLTAGDPRLDVVAAEVAADWRRLLEQDLGSEDFRVVETMMQASPATLANYRELTQILREWGVSSSRLSILGQAARALTMDVYRHLHGRRTELTAETGLSLMDLHRVAQFAVDSGALASPAELTTFTDLVLWTSREVQNGANFVRTLDREVGAKGAKLWLMRAPELRAISDSVAALDATNPQKRMYLSAKRLSLMLKSEEDFEAFNAQLDNSLAVIQRANCEAWDACQPVMRDILRLNLAGRIPQELFDLTLFGAADPLRPLLGATFTERFGVKPEAWTGLQIVAAIRAAGFSETEARVNQGLARLASVDGAEFIATLTRELQNPPSGTERAKVLRNVFEACVLEAESVLWDSSRDLAVTSRQLTDIVKAVRATTKKEKLTKLYQELRDLLGVASLTEE